MHSTRSWQDSFDKLEQSRREEQRLREAEERQIRAAEATGFMLAEANPDAAEEVVTAQPPAKSADAKSPATKAKARKRAAPRRKAGQAKRIVKPRPAKPKAAKTRAARAKPAKPRAVAAKLPASLAPEPLAATPPGEAAVTASPTLMEASAEVLLITPLQRHSSLTLYRKPGLFGLIGSWLHLAARRSKLPENLRKPSRKDGQPRDDLASLKAENKQLRRQLEALLTLQEEERASTPPWVTTPAGDVPARPRRRGGIRP